MNRRLQYGLIFGGVGTGTLIGFAATATTNHTCRRSDQSGFNDPLYVDWHNRRHMLWAGWNTLVAASSFTNAVINVKKSAMGRLFGAAFMSVFGVFSIVWAVNDWRAVYLKRKYGASEAKKSREIWEKTTKPFFRIY